jgi:outer membrane translocation and assembly module TamA
MIYRWPKAEVCLIWIVSGLICFGQILADDGKAAVSVLFGRIGITSTDNSSLDLTAINDSFGGEIVTEKTYRDLTEKILNIVLREGYLYPVLSLTAITPESDSVAIRLNPDFRLERGKRVVIDTVIYEGAERTSPELLAREARSITGQIPYSKNMALLVRTLEIILL